MADKREIEAIAANAKRKKHNLYLALFSVAILAIAAFFLFVKEKSKSSDLETQLKAAKDEAVRQEQLMKDLEAHFNGQAAELTKLQEWKKQTEELLNIYEVDPVITSQQIRAQLNAVSELVTQRYMYTNASKNENNKKWLFNWDMPFSEKSFVVTYDGVIKAGIDLKDVKIDVNEDKRVITVTLPASKITDHNVPQDKIEVFNVKNGLFNEVDINEPNELIAAGKEIMEEKATERGLLTEADREAQTLIKAFLTLIPGMDSYELIIK